MIGIDQNSFDLSAWLAVAQALTAFAALVIAPDTIKKLYERFWYSVKLYPVSQVNREDNKSRNWMIYLENRKEITSRSTIYIHSLDGAYVNQFQLNGIGGGGCAIETVVDQHGDACLNIFRMPKKSKLEFKIRFDRPDTPKSLSIGIKSKMIYYDDVVERNHRKRKKTISIDIFVAHYRLMTIVLLFISSTSLIILSILLKLL